jgi:hypothetical protein
MVQMQPNAPLPSPADDQDAAVCPGDREPLLAFEQLCAYSLQPRLPREGAFPGSAAFNCSGPADVVDLLKPEAEAPVVFSTRFICSEHDSVETRAILQTPAATVLVEFSEDMNSRVRVSGELLAHGGSVHLRRAYESRLLEQVMREIASPVRAASRAIAGSSLADRMPAPAAYLNDR